MLVSTLRRFGALALAAFLFAPASGVSAQVSCKAIPPDPLPSPHPSHTSVMFSEADVILERYHPDSLRLVRAERTEYRLQSPTAGTRSRVTWDEERQQWNDDLIEATPFAYTYLPGVDGPLVSEIIYYRTDGVTPSQRDTTTYDAEGRRLTDRRQDWDAERGVWVDDRWDEFEVYEGDKIAAYTFYRADDRGPYIDTRFSAEFDARGNRTVCNYENGNWRPNSLRPSTRYRTSYNDQDQETTVIRELWSDETQTWAVADSSDFTFDDQGRPTGFVTYDLKDGEFVADRRVILSYDADGNHAATQQDDYVSASGGLRPRSLSEYTYTPDGRLAKLTGTSWNTETASWRPPQYRLTYVWRDAAVASESAPSLETPAVRLSPNPVAATLSVSVESLAAGEYRLEVVDVLGRRALNGETVTHTGGSDTWAVDVSGLAPGTYFVRLSNEGQATATAFTVVR